MESIKEIKQRYGFGPGAGYVETSLPSVRFFWSTEAVERAPLIYNAGIVLILQGSKIGYLGDRVFHYNREQYLVLSLPTPFECATFATPHDPMLGLFIDVNRGEIQELIDIVDEDYTPRIHSTVLGVKPAPIDDDMRDSIQRLLKSLCSDAASRALGTGAVREILFHALSGPHGAALRALTRADSHFQSIAESIVTIRENYHQPLKVEDLARSAGMSAPVFYRSFKNVTGSPPHQYLKATRLHRAKGLIITERLSVGEAARRVGYDSAAHFSREFKKYFHVTPKDAPKSAYKVIDI